MRRIASGGGIVVGLVLSSVLGAISGCAGHPVSGVSTAGLARAEGEYIGLRSLRDTLDVARARGVDRAPSGEVAAAGERRFVAERTHLREVVSAIDTLTLARPDRRAWATMARTLETDLTDDGDAPSNPPGEVAGDTGGYAARSGDACDTPAHAAGIWAGDTAAARALQHHVYDCYGRAAEHVVVGRDTIDRLTVLERIADATDPARRQQLFLALAPMWHQVNGDDDTNSPYRALLRIRSVRGAPGSESPLERAADIGVEPATLEHWLVTILDAWRASTPDSLIEPWDYYYLAADADRRLAARIPRDSLLPLTLHYYKTLGADVPALGVHYDLAPRPGKTPVANTTFGSRGHADGDRWVRSESWVFATYETGGLGNLDELVHETGHGIHLAAIQERPAYEDWPDSDPMTEAIADIAALSVYEPAWQSRFLGDSVNTASATRAKYASIVMDIAWALFEVRLHEDPAADPNQVWTDITSRYLHIAPQPTLSWWAMRGQLIDSPGYMMNYALGAVIVTAVRERIRVVHGAFATGDSTWYPWLSAHLLRFGLARPTRDVLREFLGGPLTVDPLLRDLSRMRARVSQ